MFRLLLTLAFVAVGACQASPALGSPRQTFSIQTTGVLTSETSASGTFTTSGAVLDAGLYTETFRLVGNTIHAVKTLEGANGSLVVAITGVVENPTASTVSFRAGHWRIVSATGDFAGLHGGGSPGSSGLADLTAGTVQFAHEGAVIVRRPDAPQRQ